MNINDFLEKDLHLKGKAGGSGWYRICCPFHGEKTPSCAVHMEYPYNFGCLACGEHGSIAKLTAKVKGMRFGDALDYVRGLLEISTDDIKRLINTDERRVEIPSSTLTMLKEWLHDSPALSYAKSRGIPRYVLEMFNAGYEPLENALTVPIYALPSLDRVVGLDMRIFTVDGVDKHMEVAPKQRNKALIIPVNVPITWRGIIIVEGFFDAANVLRWLLETERVKDYTVAATCGNQLSLHHAKFFSRFDRVCSGFDADKGGDKARSKLAELIPALPFQRLEFDGGDPGESQTFRVSNGV